VRKGIATVVAALILTAGCAAKTNNRLSAPASTWLSAEISAARKAATLGHYHEALTDLTTIEASVRTFRSQRAIDDDHAARILAAVARVRTALGRYATTTTATAAPPATVAPGPGPGNGKHGHKGKGGNEGD
jgi:hypothetical protein